MRRRSILAMLGLAPVAATNGFKTEAVNVVSKHSVAIPEARGPQATDYPEPVSAHDPVQNAWERYQAALWRRDNMPVNHGVIGLSDQPFAAMRSWSAGHKRIRAIEAMRREYAEQEIGRLHRAWKNAVVEAAAPSWVRRFL